jgi:hypothetical protein
MIWGWRSRRRSEIAARIAWAGSAGLGANLVT